MGLFMVFPLVAALIVNNLVLSWVEDDFLLIIIGIVILGYTAVLGTVGAMVGGHMVGRSSRRVEAASGG